MYVVKTLNFPIIKKLRKLTFKLDQSTRQARRLFMLIGVLTLLTASCVRLSVER